MNTWQLSMVIGLAASGCLSAALWLNAYRKFRQAMFFKDRAPPVIRFGWLAIFAPLGEAWVLWMGGFFNV